MAAILNSMGTQLSDHSKNHPNRFIVHVHLGIEPKIMSLAQIFTKLWSFNDIGKVVAAILLHY